MAMPNDSSTCSSSRRDRQERRSGPGRAVTCEAANVRRFLIPLWSAGGQTPPVLALANRLVRRGHAVRLLAPPSLTEDAVATGADVVPFSEPEVSMIGQAPADALPRLRA